MTENSNPLIENMVICLEAPLLLHSMRVSLMMFNRKMVDEHDWIGLGGLGGKSANNFSWH